MINVLVVEDSPVVREFLVHILNSDPEIHVVGTAADGEEALEILEEKRPTVITMDIHMPKLDGFDATRHIMESHPTPIVIVSGSSTVDEVATTFRALEAGALSVVHRPMGIGHPDYERTAAELIQTVKLMSEVKVVRRWPRRTRDVKIPPRLEAEVQKTKRQIQVVAIGASTGGPLALQTILSALPRSFAAPILVVQHMASGFLQGFAEWLTESTGMAVHVAARGEQILPGNVYVAPDGYHMGMDADGRIALSKDDPENGLRPAVSYLFRSVARLNAKNAVGILLTGMGKDGAQELVQMRAEGAITIAQDRDSSVVHGMPGEAVRLDAAAYVLPPDKIAAVLMALVGGQTSRST